MAMEPAAISAKPAVRTMCEFAMAPVNPAANANGTVNPSDMPMTMSRTTSPAVKCFSMCGVCGIRSISDDARHHEAVVAFAAYGLDHRGVDTRFSGEQGVETANALNHDVFAGRINHGSISNHVVRDDHSAAS